MDSAFFSQPADCAQFCVSSEFLLTPMKFAFLPWLLSKHFAPIGDEGSGAGGGGGSGGSGDGAGDRQDGSGGSDDASKFITQEQLDAKLNSFRGALTKDLEKKTKAWNDAAAAESKTRFDKLDDMLGKLVEARSEPAGGKSPSDDITKHPEVQKLQAEAKRAAKLEERLQALEDEKAAAVAKERASALENAAIAAFTKHGVDPKRIPRLVTSAIARGEIKYDDDGKVVGDFGDGPEELDRGVKSWVASDEGKSYLPPRGANGSGDGAGRGTNGGKAAPPAGQSNGAKPDRDALGRALIALNDGTIRS